MKKRKNDPRCFWKQLAYQRKKTIRTHFNVPKNYANVS